MPFLPSDLAAVDAFAGLVLFDDVDLLFFSSAIEMLGYDPRKKILATPSVKSIQRPANVKAKISNSLKNLPHSPFSNPQKQSE